MKNLTKKLSHFIRENKYFFVLFIVGVLVFSVWLIAFYPGLLTPDSIDQWGQARTFRFNNHHPYLYALFIGIIQKIVYSPAIIAFIQIILAAAIPAYFLNLLIKHNYKKLPLIIIYLVYLTLPSVGIYNVTLWKDIAYTNMIFLCIVLVSRNILLKVNKEDWTFDKKTMFNLVLATTLFTITSYFRHNGIIFILVIPIVYYVLKIYTLRKALILLIACIVGYLFVNNILTGVLNVRKPNFINASVLIHMVAASFAGGYFPNEFEKQTIEKLVPIENLKKNYSCITSNSIVYNNPEYNRNNIIENSTYISDFYVASLNIIRKNIPQVLANRVCAFSNVIGLGQDRFLYGASTNDPEFILSSKIPDSTNNDLTKLLYSYVSYTSANKYLNLMTWNIFTYIILLILIAIIKRSKLVLTFVFLSLVNLLPLAAGGVGADFRFVYSVMILGIFSLSFLFQRKKLDKK